MPRRTDVRHTEREMVVSRYTCYFASISIPYSWRGGSDFAATGKGLGSAAPPNWSCSKNGTAPRRTVHPHSDDGRYYAAGTIRHHRAETRRELLRAGEENYRPIVENQTDIIVRTDLEGRLTYVLHLLQHVGKRRKNSSARRIRRRHYDDVRLWKGGRRTEQSPHSLSRNAR